jgi:hypothetical protein
MVSPSVPQILHLSMIDCNTIIVIIIIKCSYQIYTNFWWISEMVKQFYTTWVSLFHKIMFACLITDKGKLTVLDKRGSVQWVPSMIYGLDKNKW